MGAFTERLKRTTAFRDEQDARAFPARNPCHDCAFRPGSPEREDLARWDRLKAQAQSGHPFYCHFKHDGTEMPVDAEGAYAPDVRDDGSPIGYPLCRGWVAFMDGLKDRPRLPTHVSRVVELECGTCGMATDHSHNGQVALCRHCNAERGLP